MVGALADGSANRPGTYDHPECPCVGGYTCLFCNSNFQGATIGQGRDAKPERIPDYAPYTFYGSGVGSGEGVKNNAASGMSVQSASLIVYQLSNYGGERDVIPGYRGANLSNTKNDNASGGV